MKAIVLASLLALTLTLTGCSGITDGNDNTDNQDTLNNIVGTIGITQSDVDLLNNPNIGYTDTVIDSNYYIRVSKSPSIMMSIGKSQTTGTDTASITVTEQDEKELDETTQGTFDKNLQVKIDTTKIKSVKFLNKEFAQSRNILKDSLKEIRTQVRLFEQGYKTSGIAGVDTAKLEEYRVSLNKLRLLIKQKIDETTNKGHKEALIQYLRSTKILKYKIMILQTETNSLPQEVPPTTDVQTNV